jgi:streptogramin lyase
MFSRSVKLFIIFIWVASLFGGTALTLAASGRPPAPPQPGPKIGPRSFELGSQAGFPLPDSPATVPAITGAPGTSFTFLRQFGVTGQPYLADTAHLNRPWGLGLASNGIWVTEMEGTRVLRYNAADGTYGGLQIGAARQADYPDFTLDWPTDVAVGPNQHIWVASHSSQVLEFDAGGNFLRALGQAWNWGGDNDHFSYPGGLALDASGNLYVADGAGDWNNPNTNHRVQIFDKTGVYTATIGITGATGTDNNHLNQPRHLTVEGNRLYIADAFNHRIQIFDITNPHLPVYFATIGVSGVTGNDNAHLNQPCGVTVDANFVYVADTNNQRVQIFNKITRAYVATIGQGWGQDNNHFKRPSDLVIDNSNLYVADYDNFRVQVFSATTRAYVRTIGVTGVPYLTDNLHYNSPQGVAAAPDGSLYIAEYSGQRLVKLNAAGTPQWAIGHPGVRGGQNGENDYFNWPADVAVAPNGRVAVADQWNHRIQIYNPDGTYFARLGISSQSGTDNLHFAAPSGVSFASSGYLLVADTNNQRVQVFDPSFNYVHTLGVTGVVGSDNAHFNNPSDAAMDSLGNIYVSDLWNHRVQVFNSAYTYIRTMGITGLDGNDHRTFNEAQRVAVDSKDQVYVSDRWNKRIQVFDKNGGYLATVGGEWGAEPGHIDSAFGLDVSRDGVVYSTDDWNNHRVQKFSMGAAAGVQRNVNGFGNRNTNSLYGLAVFNDEMYVGAYNNASAYLYAMNTAGVWRTVTSNGFGEPANTQVLGLSVFNGQLYVATCNFNFGAQMWRYDGLSWEKVANAGIDDTDNACFKTTSVYAGQIYITSYSQTTKATRVYRSATGSLGSWSKVLDFNTPGPTAEPDQREIGAFGSYNGFLYLTTYDYSEGVTGGQVWRSADGSSWAKVGANGFGDPNNQGLTGLEVFSGQLYVGTYNFLQGAELWRCTLCDSTDWVKVQDNGFENGLDSNGDGQVDNFKADAMIVHNGNLYIELGNWLGSGMQVWRSANGTTWQPVMKNGFGDPLSRQASFWKNGVVEFNNRLYYLVVNSGKGGQVWELFERFVYAPLIKK